MKSSSAPANITTAESYLELGLHDDAEKELEKLEGEDRARREVWVLRCKIFQVRERWDALRDVAKHLISLAPDVVECWLWAAEATRKTDGVAEVEKLLRLGLQYLPPEPMLHYHLACYASTLGRH